MIDRERIKNLNEKNFNTDGEYVAYWVQSSPRIEYNHTLEFSKNLCERTGKPLFIFFILNPNYPDAKRRSYQFLLEGIREFKKNLKNEGLDLNIYIGDPENIASEIASHSVAMVTDKGYLNFNRDLNFKVGNKELSRKTEDTILNDNIFYGKNERDFAFYEIESNVIVPIETASNHEEYGAYTIRKKINTKVFNFLKNPKDEFLNINSIECYNKNYGKTKENLSDVKKSSSNRLFEIDKFLFHIEDNIIYENFIDSIPDDNFYPLTISAGESAGKKLLEEFIETKLDDYHLYSNNPSQNVHSGLSPFLHFGQIAPHYIYERVLSSGKNPEAIESFLEELVVRRELAFNFCYFNRGYSDFKKILSNWCYETLEKHKIDTRPYLYTLEELENWKTHDNYWNEAQKSLVTLGTMDSYMRMYWAKKILEWSLDPEIAFNNTLYLNNRYFLDGRDPNSYTGVAWCYGKHDRAWVERPIFGKIRYMNENGLIRKLKKRLPKKDNQ